MKTRYGVSPWVHGARTARSASTGALRTDVETDVAVLGGGVTSAAVALLCATSGLRVTVLDEQRAADAASSRGAGLLHPAPGPSFSSLRGAHGLRTARTMGEAWRQASRDAARLLREHSIRCGLEALDLLMVGADEALTARESTGRRAAGLEATWLRGAPLDRVLRWPRARGAMRLRDAFALDPYRAGMGLAAAARRHGARQFEQVEVRRIATGRQGVEVVTRAGVRVRAGTVVVATAGPTSLFAPLRRHFQACERYHVLTAPVSAPVRRALPAASVAVGDLTSGIRSLRWAGRQVLVAGGEQPATTPARKQATLTQRTGQLMYELLTAWPGIIGLQPEFGWDAPYHDTADGIGYVGAHRNYPRHLFALGGADESLTGAFLAARIVWRALTGRPDKSDAAFGFGR